MAGRHQRCNGHEFGQTSGDGERAVSPDVLQCMGSKKAGHEWATE